MSRCLICPCIHVHGNVYMCMQEWSPLPFETVSMSESILEVWGGGTHTDASKHTERLIWHTSLGRRMKRIFEHWAVWRTLIHISSFRVHPAIIKQINWTFTPSSIDLENISVLHSLFLPTLTVCVHVQCMSADFVYHIYPNSHCSIRSS